MTVRRTILTTLSAAALVATVALAQQTVSPAPDMPADWFWHDSEAAAAPHRALIGKPAPALEVTKWFQGEVKPADTKGKVVVLDIWATWCGPCKVAMPHSDELAKKYAGKVVFAAVCSDGDIAFVPKFIAEKKLTMPMAWDEGGKLSERYATQWFPTYVAIDKKGVVRAIGLTPEAVEKAIEKLIAE